MTNSKIINNKPVCRNCGSGNISGVREYNSVEIDGKKYIMFQVKCYDCNTDNRYLADITLEETIRYEIKGSVKEINE